MKRKVCFLAFVFMFLPFIKFNASVKCDDHELEIVDFYPCDQSGFFRWCFEKFSTIYFNVTIRNLTPETKNVSIYVGLSDNCSIPIGHQSFDITMPPKGSEYYIVNFTIPQWAYVGEGKAHAGILEEGVPITPEKSTNFFILLKCTCTNVTVHVQDLRGNPLSAQVSIWHESRIVARDYTDDLGNFNASLLSGGYTAKAWKKGWNSSTYSFNVPDTTYVIIILSREGPVGGIYIPVNKLELLAPYIGLTILLAVTVMTVVYVKKRKRNRDYLLNKQSKSYQDVES
jgi:hypothetical protein